MIITPPVKCLQKKEEEIQGQGLVLWYYSLIFLIPALVYLVDTLN